MIRILNIFLLCYFVIDLSGQVLNYPWPENDPEILSSQYAMRVRDVDTVNQTYGDWQPITVFNVKPRIYGDHPIYGDDGTFSKTANKITSFAHLEIPGIIEVEVTKKYGSPASRAEISPKAFNIDPHFFDGNTVRFILTRWSYVSVNFVCPENWESDLGHIRYGMMVLADIPETEAGYEIPEPDDPGVVVWGNDIDIDSIREAEIIYFPPGDHKMKSHKDSRNEFITVKYEMSTEPLYKGQLRLKREQKIYLAPGAYVRGCFNMNGYDNCMLFGRGIISGRDYYQHEIIIPEPDGEGGWKLETATKEAFIDFLGSDNAFISGLVIIEPFHHTLPGAGSSRIEHIKIFGMGGNHDGIRTGGNTVADGLFIKTWDDYDYSYAPHTVKNSVFWPGSNGATHMIAWGNYGSGGAIYQNNYIINAEWEGPKNNSGILGSNATEGIRHTNISFENYVLENPTSYLVNVIIKPEGTGKETYLRNFNFKNIRVEYPFATSRGEPMKQRMIGLNHEGNIGYLENWSFTNLVVNGVIVNWFNYQDYFDLNLVGSNGNNIDQAKAVKNISFREEGTLYAIFVTKDEHISVYPEGANDMIHCPEGMDQTVYIIPDEGYRIRDVIVDGVSHGRRQIVYFEDVSSNHTVEVKFGVGLDYYDLEPHFFRTPVNAHQETVKDDIILWPVPASEFILLRGGEDVIKNSRYKLMTIEGRLVKEGSVSYGVQDQIDIRDIATGVYLLLIDSATNGTYIRKIMIN